MSLDYLCSGLIGSILGGIVACIITCIYNNSSEKSKLKKDIQLKTYDDVIENIFRTKQSLSHMITYVKMYIINLKNHEEYINEKKENFNDLCFKFAKDSTELMGAIDKRQLVFIEFREYIDELYKILNDTIKICSDLIINIDDMNMPDLTTNFDKLNNKSDILNKLLWSFSIDMENKFLSNVFNRRINKNIKSSRK